MRLSYNLVCHRNAFWVRSFFSRIQNFLRLMKVLFGKQTADLYLVS